MLRRARGDLRPGLRTIGYRRRAVIAFAVQEATVEIHGVYYRGQEYESLIAAEVHRDLREELGPGDFATYGCETAHWWAKLADEPTVGIGAVTTAEC